jgi:hypothetical protein
MWHELQHVSGFAADSRESVASPSTFVDESMTVQTRGEKVYIRFHGGKEDTGGQPFHQLADVAFVCGGDDETRTRDLRRDRPNSAPMKTTTCTKTSVISIPIDPDQSLLIPIDPKKWGQELALFTWLKSPTHPGARNTIPSDPTAP